MTWAALARRVDDLAAGLVDAGLAPGDRVALLVPPSPELTATAYAVWRAGGVVVVADQGLGLAGMRRALRSAAVDAVVGAAPGLAAARAMGLPGVLVAVGAGSARTRLLGASLTTDSLTARGRRLAAPAEPSPDAECAVVFTSGSTGPAKGVVYRHAQVVAQLELIRSTYGITADDRLVAAFAPFALLGPGLGVATAVPDIDVTRPQELTAATLADAVAAVDATVVFAAPAALRGVVASAERVTAAQRTALGRPRLLVSAGAPVPLALLDAVGAVLPAAEMHTPYGMTEALPVTDVSRDEIAAAGQGEGVCVGRPLPGVQVRVSPLSDAGRADGPLVETPGVTGEVVVRAGHVKERYDALWATERAGSRDPGWHRTGDVGHLDADGRLWVEGRLVHVVTTAEGPVTPVGVELRVEALLGRGGGRGRRGRPGGGSGGGGRRRGAGGREAAVLPPAGGERSAGRRGAGGGRRTRGRGARRRPAAGRHPPRVQGRPDPPGRAGGGGAGRAGRAPVKVLVTGGTSLLGRVDGAAPAGAGRRGHRAAAPTGRAALP